MWSAKGNDSSLFGTAIHNALEAHHNGDPLDTDEFVESIKSARKTLMMYGEMGEQISETRYRSSLDKEKKKKNPKKVVKDSNYAMPSHPVMEELLKKKNETIRKRLPEIVKEFNLLAKDLGFDGEVISEPLVTYTPYLMGGFVDRLLVLDRDKKICRVQDYKVNVDADVKDSKNKLRNEMEHLPSTKISQYTIQTNFYAFCLYKAGWTIEGLDAFVYDKNGWSHYELELFDFDEFEKLLEKYLMKK